MGQSRFKWAVVALIFLFGAIAQAENSVPVTEEDLIRKAVDFFITHAWDPHSGSFASEVDVNGNRQSERRWVITVGRMIWGLSHASDIDPAYLTYAAQEAAFQRKYMMGFEKGTGVYFRRVVNPDGRSAAENPADDQNLVVNEQGYGLSGMIALYQKNKDPRLLQRIRRAYNAFYRRFHDETAAGGFYDGYNLAQKTRMQTKSFNSTVYPATSFLLSLYDADPERRGDHAKTLTELGDAVLQHFVDRNTGWIVENFDKQWKPEWRGWQNRGTDAQGRPITVGVVGHNFQAAGLLLELVRKGIVTGEKANQYREAAHYIPTSIIARGALGPGPDQGGSRDSVRRETSELFVWDPAHPENAGNVPWWQTQMAVWALGLADDLDVLRTPEARSARVNAYRFFVKNLVDHERGGEYDIVTENGIPVAGAIKGGPGKGTYHTIWLLEDEKARRDCGHDLRQLWALHN